MAQFLTFSKIFRKQISSCHLPYAGHTLLARGGVYRYFTQKGWRLRKSWVTGGQRFKAQMLTGFKNLKHYRNTVFLCGCQDQKEYRKQDLIPYEETLSNIQRCPQIKMHVERAQEQEMNSWRGVCIVVFQSMGSVVIQNCFLIILIYLLWDLGEATYALQTSNFLSLNEENCPHLTRLL